MTRLGDDYRLIGDLPGAFGPPDPPEDGRVHTCPTCGVEYASGGYGVAHSFEPCEPSRCGAFNCTEHDLVGTCGECGRG